MIDDIVVSLAATPTFAGTQGFEAGSFEAAGYTSDSVAGPNRSSLTPDSALVIAGKYSVYADNASEDWYEFLSTRPDVLALSANTTYRVRFSYRVVRPIDAGSAGFLFFARSETAGVLRDVGTTYYAKDLAAGSTGMFDVAFTTKNFGDYRLIWSMQLGGAIVIDDIRVEKGG